MFVRKGRKRFIFLVVSYFFGLVFDFCVFVIIEFGGVYFWLLDIFKVKNGGNICEFFSLKNEFFGFIFNNRNGCCVSFIGLFWQGWGSYVIVLNRCVLMGEFDFGGKFRFGYEDEV